MADQIPPVDWLPVCMMPDGQPPCVAHTALLIEVARLCAETDSLRHRLTAEKVVADGLRVDLEEAREEIKNVDAQWARENARLRAELDKAQKEIRWMDRHMVVDPTGGPADESD